MSAWHDRVGDFTLFEALTGGAFDRQNGNTAGNLTKIFQKSQMSPGLPGGGGGGGGFWNWPVHYDVAATIAGEKTGVVTQIKTINGKCLYMHCYLMPFSIFQFPIMHSVCPPGFA